LVFGSIRTSDISIALLVVLLQSIMFGISRVVEYMQGRDGDTQASGTLVLTFANCANHGLPVLLFAFGHQGFALGIVFVLISIMMLAIGVSSWHKGMPWVSKNYAHPQDAISLCIPSSHVPTNSIS